MATKLLFLSSARFELIYYYSCKYASWEIVGNIHLINPPISDEELRFVLKHTGRKFMEVKE